MEFIYIETRDSVEEWLILDPEEEIQEALAEIESKSSHEDSLYTAHSI